MLRYEFAWQRLMDRKTKELKKLGEERAKSGRGHSNAYLRPSEGWLQAECDETENPQGSVRNEPSVVFATDSHGKFSDRVPSVLRNEPKDASCLVEGRTDGKGDSLRNEPKVISEAVAVGREDGTVEEKVVREEGLVVRSVRFDEGLSDATRYGANLLRPGIGLRDAVRSGNREGGGGSRRERRLRKKQSMVSGQ